MGWVFHSDTGAVVGTIDLASYGLTAQRLVQTDAQGNLASVANLANWIAATTNQTTVSDDGDGSVTVGTVQDIDTNSSPQFSQVSVSALKLLERSSDPPDPSEGEAVMWMSDGTGSGDDGDIMIKIKAGGTVKTGTLVDFSVL